MQNRLILILAILVTAHGATSLAAKFYPKPPKKPLRIDGYYDGNGNVITPSGPVAGQQKIGSAPSFSGNRQGASSDSEKKKKKISADDKRVRSY